MQRKRVRRRRRKVKFNFSELSSQSVLCPVCGKDALYISRPRNKIEKTLKSLRLLNYYRCHACNWRHPRIIDYAARLEVFKKTIFIAFIILILLAVVVATFHNSPTRLPGGKKGGKKSSEITHPMTHPVV